MLNRITRDVAAVEAHIEQRILLGLTTAAKLTRLRPQLGFSVPEYVRFQELKTLAVANGFLTADEGQTVYTALADTDNLSVAQLVVLNGLLAQLLSGSDTYTAPVCD